MYNLNSFSLFITSLPHSGVLIQGCKNFPKIQKKSQKLQVPEAWHEAGSVLRIHKYQTPLCKIQLPGRPATWDLCPVSQSVVQYILVIFLCCYSISGRKFVFLYRLRCTSSPIPGQCESVRCRQCCCIHLQCGIFSEVGEYRTHNSGEEVPEAR